MSAHDYTSLVGHVGHRLACVVYAEGQNVAVECETCHEVLLDYDEEGASEGAEEEEPGAVDPDERRPVAVVLEMANGDISVHHAPEGIFVMVRDYDVEGLERGECRADEDGHLFTYRAV